MSISWFPRCFPFPYFYDKMFKFILFQNSSQWWPQSDLSCAAVRRTFWLWKFGNRLYSLDTLQFLNTYFFHSFLWLILLQILWKPTFWWHSFYRKLLTSFQKIQFCWVCHNIEPLFCIFRFLSTCDAIYCLSFHPSSFNKYSDRQISCLTFFRILQPLWLSLYEVFNLNILNGIQII